MTETTIFRLALSSSVILLFAIFAWMPVLRGPRAFFGVRVDEAYLEGEGRRILTRYRVALAAVFALAAVAAFVLSQWLTEIVVLIVTELVISFAPLIIYTRFASAVRPHASAGAATRFASSMRARGGAAPMWIEALVATLAALAVVVPALSYDEMPLRIPIHWNAAGEVDGWAKRGLFAVFFLPALSIYLQAFLYVLRRDLGGAKMTLPADSTEDYLQAKEKFLQTNLDTVDWARVMIAILFCGIALLQTFTAVERLRSFEPAARVIVFGGAAVMFVGIAVLIVRMVKINARLRAQTGDDYAQRDADERHWIHGGMTYSNPDDPALVVEKLAGIGYTLNMAHPGIRRRVLLFSGIPVFVIVAVLML